MRPTASITVPSSRCQVSALAATSRIGSSRDEVPRKEQSAIVASASGLLRHWRRSSSSALISGQGYPVRRKPVRLVLAFFASGQAIALTVHYSHFPPLSSAQHHTRSALGLDRPVRRTHGEAGDGATKEVQPEWRRAFSSRI